jgi:hypothetical protein
VVQGIGDLRQLALVVVLELREAGRGVAVRLRRSDGPPSRKKRGKGGATLSLGITERVGQPPQHG